MDPWPILAYEQVLLSVPADDATLRLVRPRLGITARQHRVLVQLLHHQSCTLPADVIGRPAHRVLLLLHAEAVHAASNTDDELIQQFIERQRTLLLAAVGCSSPASQICAELLADPHSADAGDTASGTDGVSRLARSALWAAVQRALSDEDTQADESLEHGGGWYQSTVSTAELARCLPADVAFQLYAPLARAYALEPSLEDISTNGPLSPTSASERSDCRRLLEQTWPGLGVTSLTHTLAVVQVTMEELRSRCVDAVVDPQLHMSLLDALREAVWEEVAHNAHNIADARAKLARAAVARMQSLARHFPGGEGDEVAASLIQRAARESSLARRWRGVRRDLTNSTVPAASTAASTAAFTATSAASSAWAAQQLSTAAAAVAAALGERLRDYRCGAFELGLDAPAGSEEAAPLGVCLRAWRLATRVTLVSSLADSLNLRCDGLQQVMLAEHEPPSALINEADASGGEQTGGGALLTSVGNPKAPALRQLLCHVDALVEERIRAIIEAAASTHVRRLRRLMRSQQQQESTAPAYGGPTGDEDDSDETSGDNEPATGASSSLPPPLRSQWLEVLPSWAVAWRDAAGSFADSALPPEVVALGMMLPLAKPHKAIAWSKRYVELRPCELRWCKDAEGKHRWRRLPLSAQTSVSVSDGALRVGCAASGFVLLRLPASSARASEAARLPGTLAGWASDLEAETGRTEAASVDSHTASELIDMCASLASESDLELACSAHLGVCVGGGERGTRRALRLSLNATVDALLDENAKALLSSLETVGPIACAVIRALGELREQLESLLRRSAVSVDSFPMPALRELSARALEGLGEQLSALLVRGMPRVLSHEQWSQSAPLTPLNESPPHI